VIHDLTHPIHTGMPTYPGDPPVRIDRWPEAAPWQVSAVCLGSHSGTHVDAPRHVDPAGPTLDQFAPDRFVGRGLLLDATGAGENESLTPALLTTRRHEIRPGSFVVIRTGWDQYWENDRYFRHPYLGRELAASLARLGVGLVGIDALSIDSSVDGGSTAHEILLGANLLVVENLRNLSALQPDREHDFIFAPLALGECDGAPVRALAVEIR
jgi:arylformamidase